MIINTDVSIEIVGNSLCPVKHEFRNVTLKTGLTTLTPLVTCKQSIMAFFQLLLKKINTVADDQYMLIDLDL